MITTLIFGVILLVGDTLHYAATAGDVRTEFTDDEIVAALYSDYHVPVGFYADTGSSVYLAAPPAYKHELCTDSIRIARQWLQASDQTGSEHRRLLSERETDRFFEFKTQSVSHPYYLLLQRVHKCRYLNRSGQDQGLHYWWMEDFTSWFQGVLNARPINKTSVQELAEYLWFMQTQGVGGARAMSSFTTQDDSEICHTIYMLRSVWLDDEVYDEPVKYLSRQPAHVTLVRLDYHVDKETGRITLDSKAIRTLDVKNNPGEVIGRLNPER